MSSDAIFPRVPQIQKRRASFDELYVHVDTVSEADADSQAGAGTPVTGFPTSKDSPVPDSPRRRSGSNLEVVIGGVDHRETPKALQSQKKGGSILATAGTFNSDPTKLPTDGDYVGIGGNGESSTVQPGPHLGGWILGSKRGSKSSITSLTEAREATNK